MVADYRFAGAKKRERNSRSPYTRPISLNEKNGINAIEKIMMTKRNALGLPSPTCGKLSRIVLPLNFPTCLALELPDNHFLYYIE
jgi:hypothetical protein